MAGKLMRDWRLAVLRVELNLSERTPAVDVDLLRFPDGTATIVESWTLAPEQFNLPSGRRGLMGDEPSVPDELIGAIRDRIYSPDFDYRGALWIHIIKPHGYLGAIPWERAFVERGAPFPIVRLPDRLPVAQLAGRTYRVAVIMSGRTTDPGSALAYLDQFAGALTTFIDSEVHVFADRVYHGVIGADLASAAVIVHDAALAVGAAQDFVDRAEKRAARKARPSRRSRHVSPAEVWSAWMSAALRKHTIDAVMTLGGAKLDGDDPVLELAADPGDPDPSRPTAYLSASEVSSLADRLGAATVCVVARTGRSIASRMLADHLGVDRPGPTLFSDVAGGDEPDRLAESLAVLREPDLDLALLDHPGLFAYLQPEVVSTRFEHPDEFAPPNELPTAAGPSVTSLSTSPTEAAESVPAWVGSAARLIESTRSDLWLTGATGMPRTTTSEAYATGTEKALRELEEMVVRHASSESVPIAETTTDPESAPRPDAAPPFLD